MDEIDSPSGAERQAGADRPQSARGDSRATEPTRAERTVARRAAEARATIPDFELSTEVDMHETTGLCDTASPAALTAVLVRASARSLRESPRANGAYRDGRFESYSRVNIAVASWLHDGFALPTIFDADTKGLAQIITEIEASAARARADELTPPEVSGATFTLYNLGGSDVAQLTPIITPPQAAALGAGAVREIPVVRDGQIVPGQVMTITLASDHRILYGALAAEFLARIKALLEHPGLFES